MKRTGLVLVSEGGEASHSTPRSRAHQSLKNGVQRFIDPGAAVPRSTRNTQRRARTR